MEKNKILLVEDTAAILKLTKFRLEKAGFMVSTAQDGRSALEAIKQSIPDLILLDYGLPDMSGEKIVEFLRADPKYEAIPIIIFTASLETFNQVKNVNVNDVILKPYEPQELIGKIKKSLGQG